MPDKFVLYQTIPASEIEPGEYRVACKLWVEVAKKTSCRLFANNNVQYYGTESDYTNLLTPGEINTYAGYAGGNTADVILRDMEVTVTVGEGEDLTIGIKTGNKKNNGSVSTNDNAGWFKVDYFRIHRLDNSGVEAVETPVNAVEAARTGIYNLYGQLISTDAGDVDRLSKGIYIVNGKKTAVK